MCTSVLHIRSFVAVTCHYCRVPTDLESQEIFLARNVRKSQQILLMVRGKWCVSSELHDCCLFLSKNEHKNLNNSYEKTTNLCKKAKPNKKLSYRRIARDVEMAIQGHSRSFVVVTMRHIWLPISIQNENTHSVHVITDWWWKRVGVGEEEPTKNYIKLVLEPQMGRWIMPNTVRESQEIAFLKLSANLVLLSSSLWWLPAVLRMHLYFTVQITLQCCGLCLCQVEILVGKDKGKQGLVNCIIKERNWVYVEGLNCVCLDFDWIIFVLENDKYL